MTQRLIATALLTLAALPAQAQEHAAEGAGLSPFAGNVGNAIWTLAIFLLVVIDPRQVRVGTGPRPAAGAREVHP